MTRTFFLVASCAAVVACSTDQFVDQDGGPDGDTTDAPHADAAPDDGATDAPAPAEGGFGDGGGDACALPAPPCNTQTCTGSETCCVASNNSQCTGSSSCFGFSLACLDKSDCAVFDGGGQVVACCFHSDAGIEPGCPDKLNGTGGSSTCGLALTCNGRHLCQNDAECNGGTCIHAEFNVAPTLSIGICSN